jgi:hypothetical protein
MGRISTCIGNARHFYYCEYDASDTLLLALQRAVFYISYSRQTYLRNISLRYDTPRSISADLLTNTIVELYLVLLSQECLLRIFSHSGDDPLGPKHRHSVCGIKKRHISSGVA